MYTVVTVHCTLYVLRVTNKLSDKKIRIKSLNVLNKQTLVGLLTEI